jgi:hypothetical protein
MDDIFESLKTFPFDMDSLKNNSHIRFYEKTRSEETKKAISETKMGSKQTPQHIRNRAESAKGFKQSEHQKDRARETFSCSWLVTNPEGKSFNIVNLRKFCSDNSLDQGNMVKVSQGILKQHKGWKCLKIGS